jgi:hypothetical protein
VAAAACALRLVRHRTSRVLIEDYLRHGRRFCRAPQRLVHERVELCFDRDEVRIVRRGVEVACYWRSYEQDAWLPPPFVGPEPSARRPLEVPRIIGAPPELAVYAEPFAPPGTTSTSTSGRASPGRAHRRGEL